MKRSSLSAAAGMVIGLATVAHAGSARIVLASHNAPVAQAQAISEQDAHRWLSDVQGAWERRDAAALVHLGVVAAAHEQRLAGALAVYRSLHVSLTNVTVSVESGRTFVSYDRTDSDETGKALKHPRRTIELHRIASDQLAAAGSHAAQN